jgi:ArsR family transcriptional regulator
MEVTDVCNKFKAVSSPVRVQIILTIADGEVSINQIQKKIGTSQSNISQHVEILRKCGLIDSYRSGHFIQCRVKDYRFIELIRTLA